jgi:hypothetical protein
VRSTTKVILSAANRKIKPFGLKLHRPLAWERTPAERVAFHRRFHMPWTSSDAERHTHKATTSDLKELWAKVANESLERTGDEGRAIREANAVVARQAEAT